MAAPPLTSRLNQLPSIWLQSLESASSWLPLSPLTHPPHSRLKAVLKLNLTLHLPEALEIQSHGGSRHAGLLKGHRPCKCIPWPLQFVFLSLGWSSLLLPHPCSSFCGLCSGVLSSGKPSLMSLTSGWVAPLGSSVPTWLTELLLKMDCDPCTGRVRAVSIPAVFPSTAQHGATRKCSVRASLD